MNANTQANIKKLIEQTKHLADALAWYEYNMQHADQRANRVAAIANESDCIATVGEMYATIKDVVNQEW